MHVPVIDVLIESTRPLFHLSRLRQHLWDHGDASGLMSLPFSVSVLRPYNHVKALQRKVPLTG